MFIVWVRNHEVSYQSGSSFHLSFCSRQKESEVHSNLLNNSFPIEPILEIFLDKRVNALKFDVRLPFKNFPQVQLLNDVVVFLVVVAALLANLGS